MNVAGEARPTVVKMLLESLTDIVLLASSLPIPVLNYSEAEKTYFLVTSGLAGSLIVYFVRGAEPPKGRYIHVDKISGRHSFGNELSLEPNHVSVLILRVKEHGLGPL
ncbi:MAG: hypothetical protein RMJ28_06480 [Nitrososphaerota archaeon]|nr:hypothetical protein [Candidatus Calditenuaceae archaeon]MDW8073861.1 hypothetical protein [Nitrososphaerota archaeon]